MKSTAFVKIITKNSGATFFSPLLIRTSALLSLLLVFHVLTTVVSAQSVTSQPTQVTTPVLSASERQYQPATTTSQNPILVIGRAKPNGTSSAHSAQHNPGFSFKFTIIAGKLWKFNIKANSFSSHKDGELRLHKNVSTDNYIIDDDGWFQYSPQQQQLFAWPSLNTKPGTYYFVLLPSGVDFESDSENNFGAEVVANIVVELIRPVFRGTSDVDSIIDHKFSLDYLHRHSSYPLLVQQLVAIFEVISKGNQSNIVKNTHNHGKNNLTITTTTPSSTSKSVESVLPTQLRSPKSGFRLSEFLLISSTYSTDGEHFSITWSTHPALSNNTLIPITECRTSIINDIITKLSGQTGSITQEDSEKLSIEYPLDASLVDSQSIVPTERGNYALKLYLNGPCRQKQIIEQLGLATAITSVPTSSSLTSAAPSAAKSFVQYLDDSPGTSQPVMLSSTPSPSSNKSFSQDVPTTTSTVISSTTTSITTTAPTVTTSVSAVTNLSIADMDTPAITLLPDTNVTKVITVLAPVNDSQPIISSSSPDTSANEDIIGIANDITDYLVSIAVPLALISGVILTISILIALCYLCIKRRKTKEFEVRDRFGYRYGSERKAFLKNSSKPVILEADQKSISSRGGTPMHKPKAKNGATGSKDYYPMTQITMSTPGYGDQATVDSSDHDGAKRW